MLESIFGFVLALCVVENGVLAWIIYSLRTRTQVLESHGSTLSSALATFKRRLELVEKQSPTELATKVAALDEGVARLARTHQRFAGRVSQQLGTGMTNNPEMTNKHAPLFCENYLKAQVEGPRSPAAACECDYCNEQRAARAEFRAQKIPATVVAGKRSRGD